MLFDFSEQDASMVSQPGSLSHDFFKTLLSTARLSVVGATYPPLTQNKIRHLDPESSTNSKVGLSPEVTYPSLKLWTVIPVLEGSTESIT